MRLLVNTTSTFKGGSVQVAASFLRECCDFEEHNYGVILGPGLTDIVQESNFPKNFRFYRIGYRPAQRVLSLRRTSQDLERFESSFGADVVFTTSGPSYWRPAAPHLIGFNLAHNLYPDSPYFRHLVSLPRRIRWRAKSQLIRHYTKDFADAWVVQTDDVNRRLRHWIDTDRVHTVPNTISSAYEEAKVGRIPGADRNGFRVLVLSSYYPHKNLEIVNEIVELLRARDVRDVRFRMTLPDRDFVKTIAQSNRSWVQNLGPQLPDDCPKLYRESDVLLMPSLLECFSANYVEAMAMGSPIVTTDLGFARTICADAALYYKPMSAADALDNLLRLKDSPVLRRGLAANGRQQLKRFGTATERAAAYLEICKDLVAQKPGLSSV